MWQMIAEPNLRCDECRHVIQPGRLCLSELPEETPRSVWRGDFRNWCIGCPQCWSQGKHACYVRHLDSGGSVGKTPRSLPCARCGRRIGTGEKAGVDVYYEWPEGTEEGNGHVVRGLTLADGSGAALTAAGANVLIRGVPDGSWESLRDSLQRKFASGGRVSRTASEAQAFYQDSIPYQVRNLGEGAVWRFVDGKDASHVQSVNNAPHLAADNSNIIWEASDINRLRGAENMTGGEQLQAQASNAVITNRIMFRDCLQTAGITALYAGLLEAPVSAIENYLHYRRGRKTGGEAVKEAAIAITQRAATGAAVGFTVTLAVAVIPGAAPILATIAPVLLPVGLVLLYAYNALKRIMNAYAHDLPLHRVGTYFCSPRCHTKFAYETGHSALLRWEANRVATV